MRAKFPLRLHDLTFPLHSAWRVGVTLGFLVVAVHPVLGQQRWQRPRTALNSPLEVLNPLPTDDRAVPLFGDTEPQFTDDLQLRKEQRFDALRRQIDDLSRLINATQGAPAKDPSPRIEHPPERMESPPSAPLPPQPHVPPPSAPGVPIQNDPQHAPAAAPPAEAHGHSPQHKGPPAAPVHATHDHLRPQEKPADAGPVVRGEVDRLALATSLYGSRDWDGCLHILSQAELSQRSQEDKLWAEYLTACCHFKLDRPEQAQAMFRRILAEENAGWIGELAKWWLEHLTERARLKTDVQRLSQTLSNWEQVVDGLAPQP